MSLLVDIKKRFGDFQLDVNFEVQAETFGLLGSSGCGKSLTMRCIAGIEKPDEGRIVVGDTTFFDSEHNVNLTPQQRKTALLFQNYMLFPNLTVQENVGAGIGKNVSREERAARINQELVRFDIEPFAQRYPAQLSGGQQQRVALARMLAARPGILMLDEPFSALDAHLKGVLEQSLTRLFDAYDGSILYVSHDIDEALRFCDRIAVIEDGHIMEVQSGRDWVKRPQSLAGIRLSGVKNAHACQKLVPHRILCPHWGVELETAEVVPNDVKAFGVRAFYVQQADGPGVNVFRMRVDRVSDSRFERTVLLSFLDRQDNACNEERAQAEMRYLHERLFWRIDLLATPEDHLPREGDELLIHIDPQALYLVEK